MKTCCKFRKVINDQILFIKTKIQKVLKYENPFCSFYTKNIIYLVQENIQNYYVA